MGSIWRLGVHVKTLRPALRRVCDTALQPASWPPAPQGNRWRWKVMVGLALQTFAGCEHALVYTPPGAKLLTAAEMDQITVGSAAATVDAAAGALPPGSAAALTSTSTISLGNASPGYLGSNFSSSQLAAIATSGQSAGSLGHEPHLCLQQQRRRLDRRRRSGNRYRRPNEPGSIGNAILRGQHGTCRSCLRPRCGECLLCT